MESDLNSAKILLIEDDRRLAERTAEYLEANGFSVEFEGNGRQAISKFRMMQPDLVLLDLQLPGMDGVEICRALRQEFNGPIIMLTARDTNLDQVLGLEAGADDYITKPADPMMLLARIRAQLRRAAPVDKDAPSEIIIGGLVINTQAREAHLNGEYQLLTSLEFSLLCILAENAGKVIDREQLHMQARGIDYDGLDRTVDVRISRLRKKLGDLADPPRRIKTIWGKGYLLVPDAW